MSHTAIIGLNPNIKGKRSLVEIKEISNSWGSAPVIWSKMMNRYYGKYSLFCEEFDMLFKKYDDKSLPEYERVLLMMTMDRSYVSSKNYSRAGNAIRDWLKFNPPEIGKVDNWSEIASIYESKPDHEAIAIHHTSVSENPFEGEWNELNDEYDIDLDDSFEIYSEVDELEQVK